MKLTAKQQLFAEAYAFNGNATRAAIVAGCPPKSAAVMGHRWSRKVNVQELVQVLRELHFSKLRNNVCNELYLTLAMALEGDTPYREGERALRLLTRLGILQQDVELRDYIEELERRCGRSIRDIVAAAYAAEDQADWEEYRAEHQGTATR